MQYAVADRAVYAHATSNDPLAPGQWYLTAAQPSAINANSAWDATTGSNGVVIAVLDTGARFEHPDLKRASLGGRLLPGYDFISANSGGGFFVMRPTFSCKRRVWQGPDARPQSALRYLPSTRAYL